jgi:hypothetical protein
MSCVAVQVPRPQQSGEADIRPQGLCHPGSRRPLLLPHLLQYRRRVPCQHCRLHHPQLLLVERLVQLEQGR